MQQWYPVFQLGTCICHSVDLVKLKCWMAYSYVCTWGMCHCMLAFVCVCVCVYVSVCLLYVSKKTFSQGAVYTCRYRVVFSGNLSVSIPNRQWENTTIVILCVYDCHYTSSPNNPKPLLLYINHFFAL